TILTIGSQKGTLIGCEGDDAHNVVSGIDFLRNMEMTGQKHDFSGKTVAVVGGGNTAMDCCRTAVRCNAEKVYVIYRRAEEQMPANPIEIHESKLEGVEYLLLTNPKRINKDENGYAKTVTLLKMKLGEPDKSGRRRPIPIEGSEFDLSVDFIMAAIGQKTQVNFIEDINQNTDSGALELNRWGDIDANPDTLQTGIPDVFAAGDGVTGPATIIEAIAQAKLASHSANQFVNGVKDIQPPKKEFFSKKENFREQKNEDYKGHFVEQKREEMPTLPPDSRVNFKEVELGYADENVARHEAQRCLECGCVALYECDLKKYSTEYEAEQTSYAGDYNEFEVDFRHPYVEIDSNKCILCSRCIRMCKEVVGANALGLINRGFNTYVAPTMGDALQDTSCESCGMCIETCPTGAITENVAFKPGPVKTQVLKTPDYFGSEGYFFGLKERNKFWYGATAIDDDANTQKLISPQAKFGYTLLNNANRITQPLKKTKKGWEPVSFEDAYELIHQKIREVKPDENAFFAGARLTNEELYLIQKLARGAAKTNNINSFHYLNRGNGYFNISQKNVPFEELIQAHKIVVMGTDLAEDHPITGYLINQARNNGTEVVYITNRKQGRIQKKADKIIPVSSVYAFTRAVNHYLVTNHMENGLFIKDHVSDFEEFRQQLLSLDFDELYAQAQPCCMDHFAEFAKSVNETEKTVFVFSEKQLSSNAAIELRNLNIITGKLGKTASGLLSLKEKNNAQGLADMGINSDYGVGGMPLNKEFLSKMKKVWDIHDLTENHTGINTLLQKQALKNLFIFGEDPLGCAIDKAAIARMIQNDTFMVVQDYFLTATAEQADLILPASWPVEVSGSFTNTQKQIRMFEKQTESPLEHDNTEQLVHLLKKFGMNGINNSQDALNEAFSLIAGYENEPLKTILTDHDNTTNLFDYGCDTVNKRVEEAFSRKGLR
ncbi:MAG: molybdopterin-dependent oxidoreductase, partial [Bacteroidota bacterium]